MSGRRKVTVVGAGNVGATVAQHVAQWQLADVVLVDIQAGVAAGKALDMAESASLLGFDARLTGGDSYDETAGSDVVVITAGVPRKPGMDRSDLLNTNAKIVGGVCEQVKANSPDAVIVTVTNPLDTMTYLAAKVTGFPRERIIGMAGALDRARFESFIGMELGASVKDIRAMVLGGHGDSMVPLPRHTTVAGIALPELLDADAIERLVERTRKGGGEIVKLLEFGSAWYAPGAAAASMVRAILDDEGRVIPSCVALEGEYGLDGVYTGVPCMLGADGLRRIIELDLADDERAALHESADHVRKDMDLLDQLLEESDK